MILKSTDRPELATEADYNSGLAYMYVWQLLGLNELPEPIQEPIKLGFAQYAYKRGRKAYTHGAQSRIIGNLREIEKAFNVDKGLLSARILSLTVGDWEDTLASEQYVHMNEKHHDNKIINIVARDYPTLIKAWNNHGGKTEWYALPKKTMLARMACSWRKNCQELGRTWTKYKRENGIHGVPEFHGRALEGGI